MSSKLVVWKYVRYFEGKPMLLGFLISILLIGLKIYSFLNLEIAIWEFFFDFNNSNKGICIIKYILTMLFMHL
jgi:hypothetical protein